MINTFIKVCPQCGSQFSVTSSTRAQKYCSQECYWKDKPKLVIKMCMQCGNEYEAKNSDRTLFCSHQCRGKHDQKRIIRKCLHCSKEIETTVSENKFYCDRDCWRKSRKKPANAWACSKCGIVKHKDKFANPSWCKVCAYGASKKWAQKPENRHKYAVNDARRRGLEWTISKENHVAMMSQPCHYCHGPLSDRGTGLDRINNDKGYLPDNVVSCCGRCNRVRHDYFTYEEMVELGNLIEQLEARRLHTA